MLTKRTSCQSASTTKKCEFCGKPTTIIKRIENKIACPKCYSLRRNKDVNAEI